jgi:NADPH-dependent ferric siderophore reductase
MLHIPKWLGDTMDKAMHWEDDRQVIAGTDTIKYDEQATHHFFFGDETALAIFNQYKQLSLQRDKEYFGVVELSEAGMYVLQEMRLLVDCVPINPQEPAAAAIQWMEEMHPDCWASWKNATYYLVGKALSVQRFSAYLQQRQVSPKKMRLLVL